MTVKNKPGHIIEILRSASHRVDFWLEAGDRGEMLNQLGLIYLVSVRHNGEVSVSPGASLRGDGLETALIDVQFENFKDASDAVAHCYASLNQDGFVQPSYVGALPRADPRLRNANRMFDEFNAEP